MKARRSKTAVQQNRYYEVENIYQDMFEVFFNGNINQYRELYKELSPNAKREFIQFCFSEIRPQYWEELILITMK